MYTKHKDVSRFKVPYLWIIITKLIIKLVFQVQWKNRTWNKCFHFVLFSLLLNKFFHKIYSDYTFCSLDPPKFFSHLDPPTFCLLEKKKNRHWYEYNKISLGMISLIIAPLFDQLCRWNVCFELRKIKR